MAETSSASTPGATAAVAQSRYGEPRPPAPGGPWPGEGRDFTVGPGVMRAAAARPYERKSGDPVYRPLRVYARDPAASRFEGLTAVVNVPYEPLEVGPRGRLIEVVDRDGESGHRYSQVDLESPRVLITSGRTPSTSDWLFHQQMVYAVTASVCAAFQRALGRHTAWGFERDGDNPRLQLRPHAGRNRNAWYDKQRGEVCFGYFDADENVSGRTPPGAPVFACLSHDVIAHEVTHALLDGMRSHFVLPTGPDVPAFHEAFADLVAVFLHFSYEQVVLAGIASAGAEFHRHQLLAGLAQQFGNAMGLNTALRQAIDPREDTPQRYDAKLEEHALGAILVAAVFDAFTSVFRRKTARYMRLASQGTGRLRPGELPADLKAELADQAAKLAGNFLNICIRAIDYCPPVDVTFGEYLRALITADHDLVPDDKWGYREALIDAFSERGIYPGDVDSLSEDALLWRGPKQRLPTVEELTFARLQFAGDPCRPASTEESRRQACALGRYVTERSRIREFGLVLPCDPKLQGDKVSLPCVESVRTTRRVGPDGQIVFDLVAEVTQQRTLRASGGNIDISGGSTIILGPDGDIRFVVSKSVVSEGRIAAQLKYVQSDAGRSRWRADGTGRLQPRLDSVGCVVSRSSGDDE